MEWLSEKDGEKKSVRRVEIECFAGCESDKWERLVRTKGKNCRRRNGRERREGNN